MEQHPVPSHIASYEFRLVGDMTLKQFLQVAGGALVALLFYALPIPGILKWPAILIAGLTGTALAFLPLEERPLSAWIVAFIRAIYSPTLYSWQQGKTGDFFAEDEGEVPVSAVAVAPRGERVAEEYLATVAGGGAVISVFEEKEKSFLQKITSLFPQVLIPGKKTTLAAPRPQFIVEEVQIPAQQQSVVEPTQAQIPTQEKEGIWKPAVSPTLIGQRFEATQARFALGAAPPSPPNIPNVVVGQIIDGEGKVLEAAILEIRDSEGRPVRALRTNKVGHFLTATPLQPGVYEIIVEKEGYEFKPIQFTANNELIPPIEIRGEKTQGLEFKTQNQN